MIAPDGANPGRPAPRSGTRAAAGAGGDASAAPSLAPDQRVLDRYRLLERLGSGGFGEVWRAHDELLHRQVALKRILGGDGERAAREAKAAARLNNPAIVALYEAAYEDGVCHLISELVEGDTLAVLIADDVLEQEEVMAIGLALCDALRHAHARGVIHRDVKPHNILVPADRGERGPAAKLTDFGGALLDGEQALTRTGDVLGTLAYMAPEQSEGREAGPAADLYALALVLYEALTGENPVRAATPAATVRRIGSRLPPLRRLRGGVDRGLAAAIDRALLPGPKQRGEISDLAAALARSLAAADDDLTEADLARTLLDEELDTASTPAREDADRDLTVVRPIPRRLPRAAAAAATPAPAAEHGKWNGAPLAPSAAQPVPAESARGPLRSADVRGRLALPRLIWLVAAVAVAVAETLAGKPGLALIWLAAALPLLVAMPRRAGPVWLLGALAPVLGLVGLAVAAPALAGQPRAPRLRASLGALAYWWLSLAELALGRRMAPGAAFARASAAAAVRRVDYALPSLRAPARWEGSIAAAAHSLGSLLSAPVLAAVVLWGVCALVLPLVVRGRDFLIDLLRVLAWAAVLLLGPALLQGWLRPAAGTGLSAAIGSGVPIAGAVLGALIGLGLAALRSTPPAREQSL